METEEEKEEDKENKEEKPGVEERRMTRSSAAQGSDRTR
jgi:hypothetical protein